MLRENGFRATVDLEAYEPVGCARCGGSGYKGRLGLYEVMIVTDEIRAAHRSSGAPADEIAARSRCARACAACATTASTRCTPGRTSIAEVARVAGTGSPVAEF